MECSTDVSGIVRDAFLGMHIGAGKLKPLGQHPHGFFHHGGFDERGLRRHHSDLERLKGHQRHGRRRDRGLRQGHDFRRDSEWNDLNSRHDLPSINRCIFAQGGQLDR